MRLIEIVSLENGAHRNQECQLSTIPDGWAIIPDEIETPNFPFGNLIVDNQNPPVVINWEPLPIPIPNLKEIKDLKIAEIKQSCEDYIYAGTNVTLPDNTVKHFSYTLADQSNISEMFTAIMAGATAYPYHADGEVCKIYSKEQIVAIYGTMSLFKTEATTYHNSLKAQINAMTDVDAIDAVKFKETALEGEYLENYAAMMTSAQTQLNAVLARIPSDEASA